MLNGEIKETVNQLNNFDKALLIEYLFESLNTNEDREILNSWINESESRLDLAINDKIDLIDYSQIKNDIL